MKFLKSALSLLICAGILLSLLPVLSHVANAATVTYAVEGGELTFDPGRGAITACSAGVTVVQIPEQINGVQVTTIGEFAFFGCTALSAVSFPAGLTTIERYAFNRCTALTVAELPDSVTSIGAGAFLFCSDLKNVSIPAGVKELGNSAFGACSSLKEIVVSEENAHYSTDAQGILFNRDKTILLQCPAGKTGHYSIPETVTSICDNAFYYCEGLTSVTIPHSVTAIGEYAFSYCKSLESIEIPDSVLTLGEYAIRECSALKRAVVGHGLRTVGVGTFLSCTALEQLRMGNGVTNIEPGAFSSCIKLSTVVIGIGLQSVGYFSFQDCPSLKDVYYGGTEEMWQKISVGPDNEPLLQATVHYDACPHESVEYGNEGAEHTATCVYCGNSNSEAHEFHAGVCICGAREGGDPTVIQGIKIFHSLNLSADISISYAVWADFLRDYDSYYMECILPKYEGNTCVGSKTVLLEPELREDYYYFVLDGLISLEMNNVVQACLYMTVDGETVVSDIDYYSIATYAYAQLNSSNSPEALKAVCANLLQYGTKAQLWKGYRTDALADGAMTEEHRSYLTDPEQVVFGDNLRKLGDLLQPGVGFVGVPMRLDSKVVVRYVVCPLTYTGDPDKLELHLAYKGKDGQTKTVTLTNPELYAPSLNYYVFDFDGLLASELRTVIRVSVYEGDTQLSETVEHSPDSYGKGKTGDILSVMQALMAYSDAAKNYFAK
ncbi:MAG: leucine-rich repeat domain-containing protein [Oscillospiraceae bacterium]|nr:leucine-rich repeat domain-containing protein [Oscillospiraceae bacterium]